MDVTVIETEHMTITETWSYVPPKVVYLARGVEFDCIRKARESVGDHEDVLELFFVGGEQFSVRFTMRAESAA